MPCPGHSIGMTFRRFVSFSLIFAVAACGSDSSGVGPNPDNNPDPDPDPVDTEPDLECGLPDYPCTWEDVGSSVVERTLTLAEEGVARLDDGSTSDDLRSWLESQSDVVEVQGDELATRFRVDGGRGMWIYRPGATEYGPAPGAAPVSVDPAATSAAPAAASPGPPSPVIVGDGPAKKALVLSPALWNFTEQWDDGAEVQAALKATRGYEAEGAVVYRKNEEETSREVSPASFKDWNDFDVVHYTGHGRRVCDLSGCRAALEIGVLSAVITTGDSDAAKILQLDDMGLEMAIGEETGNKYVLVAADFFRKAYKNGLDHTLVFLNACQTVGDQALDLAEALGGGTSVVLGWSETVFASDAIAATAAFYKSLSEEGYPAQVAWEKLGDLRTGKASEDGKAPQLTFRGSPDGNDLHIREIVTLLNPQSGEKLEQSPTVQIIGNAGDGTPDAAPYRVRVEGVLEEHAGEMSVVVTVDGVSTDPIPLTDGVKNEDDAWTLEGQVQLPYDVDEDRTVSEKAVATLYTGGESEDETTTTLTGAAPLMGYEWEMVATSSSYWTGGIPHTPYGATTTLTLEFAPGQDPSEPNPVYEVTGGTVTWDWSHSYYDCVFSGPETTFDVTEDVSGNSSIRFDTSTTPARYQGYIYTFGPDVTISVNCGEDPGTQDQKALNYWMNLQGDEWENVSADGQSITGTYLVRNEFTGYAWVVESNYTLTRIR